MLRGRAIEVMSWVMLLVAAGWFAYRGPVFLASSGNYDFNLVYGSARAWLVGLNPYERDEVERAWLSAGGPAEVHPLGPRPSAVLLYPVSAFAALSPIAALPFGAARVVWSMANVAGVLGSIVILGRIAGLRGWAWRVFAALALAYWPTMSGLRLGQTPIVVLGLVCASRVVGGGGGAGRGVILGVASAIKPQLGALFVVYELGRGRWRAGLVGLAAAVVLFGVGAARSSVAGVDWWGSWRANLAAFAVGDDGNPTAANAIRHHMINLHYPLHTLTDDRGLVRVMVYGIVGGLCLAYLAMDMRRGRERGEGRGELLSLSMTSAVTLAVAYHRSYDAVILLIPMAMAVGGLGRRDEGTGGRSGREEEAGEGVEGGVEEPPWRGGGPKSTDRSEQRSVARESVARGQPARWMHGVTLALVLVHALPTAIGLVELAARGKIPAAITETGVWRGLMVPHQAWLLLALVGWLVVMRWRTGRVASGED
ncbi:MAG: glycosyltransferase family 87 protein [Phycisphaerales bacterium]